MSNMPKPHYTLWNAVHAALATGLKALEEVRALRREPGPQGEPGPPGMGFDDMKLSYDGGRKLTVTFQRGADTKSVDLTLPIPIYRGVYQAGVTHDVGDMVTFGGSCWHCNEKTQDKPGSGSKAWQLAVKQGRDLTR